MGALKANITHNFGGEFCKTKGRRMHYLHPIFKNVPGEGLDPNLQEGYPCYVAVCNNYAICNKLQTALNCNAVCNTLQTAFRVLKMRIKRSM